MNKCNVANIQKHLMEKITKYKSKDNTPVDDMGWNLLQECTYLKQ